MQELKTERYTVRVLAPRILEIIIHDHINLEVDDFWILTKMTKELSEDKSHYALVTTGYFSKASEEFLKLSSEQKHAGKVAARALLTASLGHRILGNFYMKVNKPEVQTRLFKKRDTALEWLTDLVKRSETTKVEHED